MDIIIVGGGASGLMLASLLSNSNIKANVSIIEKNEHVGKKLLLTGNGKCNLSNTLLTSSCFNNEFAFNIANSFDTVKYFNGLGLLTTIDDNNRVYPLSNTSNSVLDVLRESLKNVKIIEKTTINYIKKDNNKYILSSNDNKFTCDIVIIATGGKTYYKECNSYDLVKSLNHHVSKLKPSLTYVKVKENLASIENIRVKAKASLILNDKVVFEDKGEVLFKKDYLSGIVMFQLSSYIARHPNNNYKVELDLLENKSIDEINDYIKKYPSLIGMFPKMINQYILKQKGNVSSNIKHLTFNVIDNNEFSSAQVTCGGLLVSELKDTLESKFNDNLYFAGEIIDIDGICGGYNLQLAFASANTIYKDIIKKNHE